MIKKLTTTEIETALTTLNQKCAAAWTIEEGKLYRAFKFPNFIAAFGFMTQVAILAEKADHHPEWFNVYNRVEVVLTTHDVQGLSQRDLDLAQAMERIAAAWPPQEPA